MEVEPYLLEFVRYLHLNPLRAKIVPDLRRLDHYPWTGHSALLGTVPRPWQDTRTVLAQFGPTPARARHAYRGFVAAGIPQGQRLDLQGGCLLRSHGGWAAVTALRRGREAYPGGRADPGRQHLRGTRPPGLGRRVAHTRRCPIGDPRRTRLPPNGRMPLLGMNLQQVAYTKRTYIQPNPKHGMCHQALQPRLRWMRRS